MINKKIFCTLGPSSLNKKFLEFANKKNVDLLRLNLSHIDLKKLKSIIQYIKSHTKCNICIDTEGAQIRTKVLKKKKFKKGEIGYIFEKNPEKFKLYPDDIFQKLRAKDILDVGFEGLKIKILKLKKNKIRFITLNEGFLETNKGVHLVNRKISINFLTNKDLKAIEISKKLKINNYALSFTNSHKDVVKFNKLLPKSNKIYKIETREAIKNFKKMMRYGNNFLIDRGDLSKDILIENIPVAQRYLISQAKKMKNKEVYVATNFLESMINNNEPTRAEANDIYNSLEMGSAGLVLAAETAIGKYPEECVTFIKKIYHIFKKKNKFNF
tara:strand:+ start:29 stop:1009 length:981 start_codon:yes stop_codon:yes gene_type:complete